jgi:hypothetical protein
MQVELVSSSDDEITNLFTAKIGLPTSRPWQRRRQQRRRRTLSQPSMGQVHAMEQELSRRYEVSKEIEHSILGRVPSILESGRMATTSTEIDRNLKQVSECYAQRCELRDGLRHRLSLRPQKLGVTVPVMTFDRYHNLVPKEPSVAADSSGTSANRIKLDNMEIEVSNEIMAMIYYRALMSKFEKRHGQDTKMNSDRAASGARTGGQGTSSKDPRHEKAHGKVEVDTRHDDGRLRYEVDEDNEELDSASETDLSKLDLSSLTSREMRIRSLQRYSPRLSATMMPVFETEDER